MPTVLSFLVGLLSVCYPIKGCVARLPNLFVSLMVALDMVRDRYFYRVFYSMSYVSDGIGLRHARQTSKQIARMRACVHVQAVVWLSYSFGRLLS
ncbi:hypothetical protein PF008_g17112 [Phytophthora fragariae]|uniref:ABC transmembrane type-1 domain-containing protein n=1 Tax=Phytophthora fragariae TaxID=53985 RepID=A0A6G0RAK4_9STRA|nr:hypothetical protein PF008_g17112 [Phytophthora fragariae]